MTKKRILYLDLIRVIAVYLVIFTHTGNIGSKLYEYGDYSTARDFLYIGVDVLRRINVPLFLMVSGALMLGKEENYRVIFFKRICRYILVIIVMSLFYHVFHNEEEFQISSFLLEVYQGRAVGLFWYIYIYIGYLLSLPFLRKMVKGMHTIDYIYLLFVSVCFKSFFPIMNELFAVGNVGITFYFVTDMLFYPIIGYFFAEKLSNEQIKSIYLGAGGMLAVLCMIIVVVLTYWEGRSGSYSEKYYSMFNVIPTCFSFCLIKRIGTVIEKYSCISKVIHWLGNCSFGIYLLSVYIQVRLIWVYREFHSVLPHYPLVSSFLYVGVVVLVAAFCVTVLKAIPGVKKIFS